MIASLYRSRVTKDDSGGGIFGSSDGIGFHVVTPFTVTDRPNRPSILVNRGWVPKNKCDPRSRRDGQVEGEVELVGVVRLTEKREPFMPKNTVESRRWMSRDVDGLARALGTAPVFLDAVASSSPPGGPVGGQTRVSLRNDHFSYMLTWC